MHGSKDKSCFKVKNYQNKQQASSQANFPIMGISAALPRTDRGCTQSPADADRNRVADSTPGGDWLSAHILLYCTLENMIDGMVITFTDITISKKLEARLRKSRN